MKNFYLRLLMGLTTYASCQAQITITSDDMFNQPGEYYRAYANQPPALLNRFPVTVAGRIGEPGGPHYWDFTEGPTDEIYRYEYIEQENTIVWNSFRRRPLRNDPIAKASPEITPTSCSMK